MYWSHSALGEVAAGQLACGVDPVRRVEVPDDDALFGFGGGPQPVAAQHGTGTPSSKFLARLWTLLNHPSSDFDKRPRPALVIDAYHRPSPAFQQAAQTRRCRRALPGR